MLFTISALNIWGRLPVCPLKCHTNFLKENEGSWTLKYGICSIIAEHWLHLIWQLKVCSQSVRLSFWDNQSRGAFGPTLAPLTGLSELFVTALLSGVLVSPSAASSSPSNKNCHQLNRLPVIKWSAARTDVCSPSASTTLWRPRSSCTLYLPTKLTQSECHGCRANHYPE